MDIIKKLDEKIIDSSRIGLLDDIINMVEDFLETYSASQNMRNILNILRLEKKREGG